MMMTTDRLEGLVVLGLVKDTDQFVFLYDGSVESCKALLGAMACLAVDPDVDFNWFDAGRLIAYRDRLMAEDG